MDLLDLVRGLCPVPGGHHGSCARLGPLLIHVDKGLVKDLVDVEHPGGGTSHGGKVSQGRVKDVLHPHPLKDRDQIGGGLCSEFGELGADLSVLEAGKDDFQSFS